MLQYCSY